MDNTQQPNPAAEFDIEAFQRCKDPQCPCNNQPEPLPWWCKLIVVTIMLLAMLGLASVLAFVLS